MNIVRLRGSQAVALAAGALVIVIIAAVLAFIAFRGGDDDNGKTTVKSGPGITVKVTPLATVAVPEGPVPTRTADFAALCQESTEKQWSAMPAMVIDPKLSYTATIRTEKGDIVIKLLPDIAPYTVNNFVFLACKGFYDGLTFHRVVLVPQKGIPHPLVQAGDPSGNNLADPVMGGPGYDIPVEIRDRKFLKGTVGMSSRGAGSPTSGSQFFIVLEDSPEWDGQYTAFGEVVLGFEVLTQLTPRNPQEHGPPGDQILAITIQEG